MRDYTIKHFIVGALTALLGGTDVYAVSTASITSSPAGTGRAVAVAAAVPAGSRATHTIAFERGRTYRVEATCTSAGCGALSMRLFSPTGVELDRHVNGRPQAEVATIPSSGGRYRVEVSIDRCASDACAYALVVHRR